MTFTGKEFTSNSMSLPFGPSIRHILFPHGLPFQLYFFLYGLGSVSHRISYQMEIKGGTHGPSTKGWASHIARRVKRFRLFAHPLPTGYGMTVGWKVLIYRRIDLMKYRHLLTLPPTTREKQRCSGSYRRAVGVQVFKDDSISQRPGLRRLGSRFTVHARRNLPVKEFCYLRTVNLTAAMCFGAAKGNGN